MKRFLNSVAFRYRYCLLQMLKVPMANCYFDKIPPSCAVLQAFRRLVEYWRMRDLFILVAHLLATMIFVGQASLRRAIGEYMAHYHEEHNHQVDNTLIRADSADAANDAVIQRRQRLGGMINFYYRQVA